MLDKNDSKVIYVYLSVKAVYDHLPSKSLFKIFYFRQLFFCNENVKFLLQFQYVGFVLSRQYSITDVNPSKEGFLYVCKIILISLFY